jgi:lipopolysaccharide/colanic/teichoic acid biosynthesis glycosyltransferase
MNEDEKIKNVVKRSMDLVLLFIITPIVVPVILVVLSAVLLEQLIFRDFGPLVISEMRISKGKKFRLYKLNMYKESTRKKYILESDRYAQMGTYDYLSRDPTSLRLVGRVMKKYYLDELGQMINILFGHMSFVGPRPRLDGEEVSMSPPWQLLKTGYFCFPANLWKNENSSSLGFHSDEDYLDLYQNSSTLELLKLDVCIILDGVKAVIKGKGK